MAVKGLDAALVWTGSDSDKTKKKKKRATLKV